MINEAIRLYSLGLVFLTLSLQGAAGESLTKDVQEPQAFSAGQRPSIDAKRTVRIPNLTVPLSPHMSEEARKSFIRQFLWWPSAKDVSSATSTCPGRDVIRDWIQPFVDRARAMYPVKIERHTIAEVHVNVITPKGGTSLVHRKWILVNVYGGDHNWATTGGLLGQAEVIPIAGAGDFKVISIDYRTSQEAHFPAATEDVAAVYKHFLKSHRANSIELFGCSTGATLSAGAVAWVQKLKLARPGAVGLFGDGATKDDHVDGDGWFINAPLSLGQTLASEQSNQVLNSEPYMNGTDYNDPLIAPVTSREVLSKCPPALVITGTRDVGLSEAVYTHGQLIKAGVEAELHVWEGQWHCSLIDVDMPESKDMYDVTTKFFDRHLGKGKAQTYDMAIKQPSTSVKAEARA